jgi:hypothetical protein
MQELPLHGLSAGSVIELLDEMPRGHFRPVADLDDLGPALRRNRGIEGRDIHAVDDTPDGSEGPLSARQTLNLSHAMSAPR